MIIVADTTPLISLLKINRFDLLEKLYNSVFLFDTGLLTVSEVNKCFDNLQQSGRRISVSLVNIVRNYLNK